jgi:ectoine hydroxylase-related dioxygenase (phytanoyl-CoA dioxygenase family)
MTNSGLTSQQRQLDDLGYAVLPGFMSDAMLAELRACVEALFESEGSAAGAEFKQEPGARRLANLINKGTVFREVISAPRILELVRHVLGHNCKLSSVNARSANPYNSNPQPLHCDMSAIPDEHGYWVCNSVWMLDDFTLQNGALRAVPGSHRWRKLPQDVLDDATTPHKDEIVLTGKAGSVIVMNAHMWHGGLANQTAKPRSAIHAFFCRHDKPQQQYQKQLLDQEVQTGLAPQLRELLALDDAANDRLSSASAACSGFLK